ncbi:MAG: vanadium-dependent haloperoxidase [Steroidobacteraceae bacterium]|nr:vanadium-dependent haloperoxidase [Steroidobacteraceae bacterium]
MKHARGLMHLVVTVSLGWCLPVHGDAVTDWNAITLGCVQGPPAPPNRGGPPGLLDIALVQLAVHDAVQAIQGRFEPYHYENPSLLGVGSTSAAAAAAAYGMLVGLYGADDPCLAGVVNPAVTYAGDPGLQAGAGAAAAMLPLYRPTMTLPTDPFLGGTGPGEWRPTPGVAQGANTFMAVTAPFAMLRPSQFRPSAPPPLKSERYFREYEEVRLVGSLNSAVRTPEQTDLARFWSVNFITQWYATLRGIAIAQLTDVGDTARLFALVGVSSADSQISVYDAKYHYNYWRPITAIREGDQDGNARTIGDPAWQPFLATPPYPEYHSGANMLAASITGILRLYFGSDELSFSVSSSAANLVVNPRQYTRLTQVEQEMVDVRIYQGIHFRTADELGRFHGGRVAHWTFMKFLRPLPGTR